MPTAHGQLRRLRTYLNRQAELVTRDPLEVLQLATQLRRRLDELEQVAVAEARAASATWEAISDVLGVSRQTAHEKHASQLKGPNTDDRRARTQRTQGVARRAAD